MSEIYEDGTYLHHNPLWHQEDSPWKAKHILNIIEKNNLIPSSVGEIGCGAGEVLNQLKQFLNRDIIFSGYEISPQAFELCKKKSKDNLKFYLHNLLEDKESYFDLVLAIDIFEHVEDYYTFLRELKKKAEYKIFHIPLDLSVQTVFRPSVLMQKRKKVGHIHFFTKDIALEILKDSGYEVIDYFYTASAVDLSKRTRKAKLLNLFRRAFFSISKDFTVRFFGGYSLMVLAK